MVLGRMFHRRSTSSEIKGSHSVDTLESNDSNSQEETTFRDHETNKSKPNPQKDTHKGYTNVQMTSNTKGLTSMSEIGMLLPRNSQKSEDKDTFQKNSFFQPETHEWKLRGFNYMIDRIKINAKSMACEMIAVDHFTFAQTDNDDIEGTTKVNFGEHPSSLVSRRLRAERDGVPFLVPVPEVTRHKEPTIRNVEEMSSMRALPSSSWVLLLNFVLPWGSVVAYAEIPRHILSFDKIDESDEEESSRRDSFASIDSEEDEYSAHLKLWQHFFSKECTNEERNKRLKTLISVKGGSYFARSGITPRPMIIGKGLEVRYIRNPAKKYFEIVINVANSSAARVAIRLCRSSCSAMTFSFCFTLQGETEDELPEQVMASFGIDRPKMKDLPMINNVSVK